MIFRYIKVALFLSITLICWELPGQQLSTAPDPTLESPYNTIYVHLYYLQNDSYQPEIAAAVIPPGPDSATAVKLAIQIKQVLDGKGLFVRLNDLPQEENFQDSTTRKPYYTPFPRFLPEVYLERLNGKWYYSRETVELIPDLHDRVFPFGADILSSILPTRSTFKLFGVSLWQVLGFILIMLVCFIVHMGVSRIFGAIIRLFTGGKIPWSFISKKAIRKLARYLSIIVIVWLARMLIPSLQLPIRGSEFINKSLNIVIAVMLMMIGIVIVGIIKARAKEIALKTENRMDEQLLPIVGRILNILIVTIAIIYVLNTLRVNVTALIAGLSIGGLALALAAQDSVKNLIGSVMVFVDRPFQVDDYIIGSGFEGTVVEVGFRSTRIQSIDTSIISVPNGVIANLSVENLGARSARIFNTVLTLTYQTPVDKLEAFMERLKQLMVEHPRINDEPHYVHFKEMADSSLNIMFRCYIAVPSYAEELGVKEEIYLKILRIAEEMGVDFAYPTTSVFIERPE